MANLTCWLTRRRLGAYQDGELDPAARARTAAHLGGCPGCAGELQGLGRLRASLVAETPEPPDAVWEAFWPQVRARLATDPAPRRWSWDWISGPVGWPRFALASALAGALAVGAVVLTGPGREGPGAPAVPAIAWPTPSEQVVVQSVETADPDSSVMVFSSADAEVVWVFGLQKTEI